MGYKIKLPLIFGNWHEIKSELGHFAYLNLETILSLASRERGFRISLINGGNRELYLGARAIAEHTRNQLEEISEMALDAIYSFRENISDDDRQKTYDNSLKLAKAFKLAEYVQNQVNPSISFNPMFNPTLEYSNATDIFYDISRLELALSREITAIYLMNLDKEFEYQEFPNIRKYTSSEQRMDEENPRHYSTMRDRLQKIQHSCPEIAVFYGKLKKEISQYYLEINKNLRQL